MVNKVIGGVITFVIGGTMFTVSQSEIATNFASNTGMSQQQAQQYVSNIEQSDLQSFSKIGAHFISDGNLLQSANIDCDNYTYEWETASLSCTDGKNQIQKIANDEIALGNCYEALDTKLEDSSVKTKISECVTDIDALNEDFNLPIVAVALDSKTITEYKNSNSYNKSLLQAVLSK